MHNAFMSHAQRAQILGDVCFVRAYAKINLALDVTGRRADGYHELATVMQTVDLHDTLCLTHTSDGRVRVDCTRPELSNEENLAAQAARLVRERFSISRGVLIELLKRIPMTAGLGGGSSDAAYSVGICPFLVLASFHYLHPPKLGCEDNKAQYYYNVEEKELGTQNSFRAYLADPLYLPPFGT